MRRSRTRRLVEGGRLVYYADVADSEFWAEHWRGHAATDAAARSAAQAGFLGSLERPVARYFTRPGPILDAGCGMGHHVVALRRRGYAAHGAEWSVDVLVEVRRHHPDGAWVVADVAQLPLRDGGYAGYLSLGVVEHRAEGPDALLREAHRVLRPGGVILVSVPSFHALRRLKARLGRYRGAPEDRTFYQYAFTAREFTGLVERAGFRVLATLGYDAYKGILDEVPLLPRLLDRQLGRYHLGSLVQRALRHVPLVERRLGHMLLVVGRKPGPGAPPG